MPEPEPLCVACQQPIGCLGIVAMMRIGSVKPLWVWVSHLASRAGNRVTKQSSMTSAATRDATAPLVTLLRNALPGSD